MNSHFIELEGSLFHYNRFGSGPKWIFCFHGYGESGESFALFEPFLGSDATLIAIDIPFHGKTAWNGPLLLEPAVLIELIDTITGDNQTVVQFFAYSMGGRIALKLFELMPDRIASMVLVAPDGLYQNKWQWFTTKTSLGNSIFKHTMQNPHWFFHLIKIANQLKLINPSVSKFVHYYLDDPKERAELYKIWTLTRRFRPDIGLLKSLIKSHKVSLRLIFGKYDRIILSKRGTHFSKGMDDLVKVIEIDAGHQLLQKKYAPIIADYF
jgi:pimeloyl-ACP methyl ester carboxylesterase